MNEIILEDLLIIDQNLNISWDEFKSKTIYITGATGLIGSWITKFIAWKSIKEKLGIKLVLLVRNEEKALNIFKEWKEKGAEITLIKGDVCNNELIYDDRIDYIIHTACVTSSKMFQGNPYDTAESILRGASSIIQLAQRKKIKSAIFLSTMEVYGLPNDDRKIDESSTFYLDHILPRSSYPMAKKMMECLCACAYSQYSVPIKIVRLTQTFGPGIEYQDGRVFAQFARSIVEKRSIILHTKGQTKRSYLYTADAVTAILTILQKGSNGEAYNAANEKTYCSIYDMARMVADECGNGNVKVEVNLSNEKSFGYAPQLRMNLDTKKLQKLGWKAVYELPDMYKRMILCMGGK